MKNNMLQIKIYILKFIRYLKNLKLKLKKKLI